MTAGAGIDTTTEFGDHAASAEHDLTTADHLRPHPVVDTALSLFHISTDSIALGVEINERAAFGRENTLMVLPETHVQLGQHAQWASGLGASWDNRTFAPVAMTRIIVESAH